MANNTYNIKMLRQDFYSLEHDLTPKKVMHSVDYAMTNIQEIRPTEIVSSVPASNVALIFHLLYIPSTNLKNSD